MGAWSLGRDVARLEIEPMGAGVAETAPPATITSVEEAESKMKDFAGKVLQWIPGELVVFYGALTTIIVQNESDTAADTGMVLLTVAAVLLAPAIVALGTFSNTSEPGWFTRRVALRCGLATIAFAIWSLTIPNSGWNHIDWIADNPAPTAAIAGFLGLLFSMFATGADKHWGGKPTKN